MGKIKTPIVRPLRTKGGTLYTFSSAAEDIGLNINESHNKVRLSHYALLDIPNANENTSKGDLANSINYTSNCFNVYNMPGAMLERFASDNTNNANDIVQTPNQAIAQSFMSYALNMETVIRNAGKYDYTTSLSCSERIFWKWLKECGAIRWTFESNDNNVRIIEGDNTTENIENQYKNVVKSFGIIDSVSQRSSDYGMYNEVFVNIPSSFGYIKPVYFKQVADENYSFGKTYSTSFTDSLENYTENANTQLTPNGLFNIPFFDYKAGVNESMYKRYNPDTKEYDEGKFWFTDRINNAYFVTNEPGSYYTDGKIENNISIDNIFTLNDKISVTRRTDSSANDIDYEFLRSKFDCMMLDLSLESYNKDSYDELAINEDDSENNDYEFNTILLYYSIFDNNDNILATNLYGVYFLDAPQDLGSVPSIMDFEIPRLSKKQSSGNGFGTSYSFRINVRTSSIYDNSDAIIYDDGSSENSLISDFGNVVHNLNKSIELLSKHVKNTSKISNEYTNLSSLVIDTRNRLQVAEDNIKDILYNEMNDVVFNNVTTSSISVDDNIKFSNKLDIVTDDVSVVNITSDGVNINGNITNDSSFITKDIISDNVVVNNRLYISDVFNITKENSDDDIITISSHDKVKHIDISNNILTGNNFRYVAENKNEENTIDLYTDNVNNILNAIDTSTLETVFTSLNIVSDGNKVSAYINDNTNIPGIFPYDPSNGLIQVDIPSIIFTLVQAVKYLSNDVNVLKKDVSTLKGSK